MRKKLHIALYLILTGCVCFLVACGASKEEKAKSSALADSTGTDIGYNMDLESTFESDTLTSEQLGIFQQRAQQKLQDFINYIEIISNKSYNTEMRDVAGQQIKELFADTTVLINIPITNTQKVPATISQYLNELTLIDYDSIKVKTDSVVLSLPEKSKGTIEYIGAINGKVTINGYKNRKIVFMANDIHKAETIITKTKKQFGTESKMVWNVILGELK